MSELSSKIGGGGGSVQSKKKDQEKIIEEDNKSIKSNISSKSIKSNVSKSLFDSDSDDDLFTSRWVMLFFFIFLLFTYKNIDFVNLTFCDYFWFSEYFYRQLSV